MNRPDITCLRCLRRKFFYGKKDATNYEYAKYVGIATPKNPKTILLSISGGVFIPKNCSPYVIFIDNDRKHRGVKTAFLKRLLSVAEFLAN